MDRNARYEGKDLEFKSIEFEICDVYYHLYGEYSFVMEY